MKFFSYDSKFIEFMNTLVDVVLLNIMWLLGCIPIVTIGTSTIAAYSVSLKIVENSEGHVVSQFWKAYKENLLHGIVLTLLLVLSVWTVWIDFQLFDAVKGNPVIFSIIGVIITFFIILHTIYIFPLEARYKNTLWRALTNARRIGIRFFGRTLFIVLAVAIELFLFFGLNNSVLIFFGLIMAPMCIIITISGIVMPVFRKLEREAEELAAAERAELEGIGMPEEEIDYSYENDDEVDYESPVIVDGCDDEDLDDVSE